jgi:hypothetical protein
LSLLYSLWSKYRNPVKQLVLGLSRFEHAVSVGPTFQARTPVCFSILGLFHGNTRRNNKTVTS